MDLRLILPDLALLALILGLVFTRRHAGLVAIYGLVAIAGLQLGSYLSGAGTGTVAGLLRLDAFAVTCRLALLTGAAGVVALGLTRLPQSVRGGRTLAMLLLAVSGALLLPAASDLAMVLAALELLWLPACVRLLTPSPEAALKTCFHGATLSALYLFGATLLYGLAGTTDLAGISRALAQLGTTTNGPMLLGALLVAGALAGKLALVPFHAYFPDAAEGADGLSTAFFLTVPLVAGSALTMRVLHDALPAARDLWSPFLMVVCLLTLLAGPLLAIVQTDLRRLLAYSGITQAGFWALGLMAIAHPDSGPDAMAAVLLGAVTMALSMLAALAVFEATGARSLKDLSGLWTRSPWLAAGLVVACLGLSGLPPVAGFWAKILLFKGVVTYANASMAYGLVWLVALAAVSALALGYALLRPVRLAFLEPAPAGEALAIAPSLLAIAGAAAVGSLWLFLVPHTLWQPLLAAVAGL